MAACPAVVHQDVGLDISVGSLVVRVALRRFCCLLLTHGIATGMPQGATIQLSLACWILWRCCGQVNLHRNHWHRRAVVNLGLNLGRRGKLVSSIHNIILSVDPNDSQGSSHDQGGLHHSRLVRG